MNEQTFFFLDIFGLVGLITWAIARMLLRDDNVAVRRRLRTDEYDPRKQFADRTWSATAMRMGQAAAQPFMPKTREGQSALRRQLARAGIYNPSAVRMVIGCKVVFLGVGLVGGYLLGLTMDSVALGLSLGGLVGYLAPAIWVRLHISSHQRALTRGLPDALDLLVVCVESGLTVDAAMQRVGTELSIAHPRLSKELEFTHMETRVGVARADALKNLGVRTGSEPLKALATMMVQAERFGTSIASALRIHAESLRASRQHAAEETAAKASVKLTFPVVLFIFPAVLIVLAGPAAIGLFKSALFAN